MKKRLFFTRILFLLMGYSTGALSVPASTEYVNTKIKEAIHSIQTQLTQENKKIEGRISEIPVIVIHQLGELYQGGVIFWLDETKQHGLVVAKLDANQGVGIQWHNGESGDKTTNAQANGIYAGLSNTQLIVAQQTIDDQEGNFAALSAKNFSVLSDGVSPCTQKRICYGNWYLPSLNELQLVKANLYDTGARVMSSSIYWTSTEGNVNQAMTFDWNTGGTELMDKSSFEPKVRAIHAF